MKAAVLARGFGEDVVSARRLRRVVARAARRERAFGEGKTRARVAAEVHVAFVARDDGLARQSLPAEVFDAKARLPRGVRGRLELRGLGQLGERPCAACVENIDGRAERVRQAFEEAYGGEGLDARAASADGHGR